MTNEVLTPTIFHEDWWLDAATNGAYEVAEVSNGGKVVGRLPYFRTRKFGMKWGGLPALTHFLGPAVDEGVGNMNRRFVHRLEITRDLIQKLPPARFTRIKCHRGVPDVIAFQEQKFRATVQFTWEIHPQPAETLWANMRDRRRSVIRQAEKSIDVSVLEDPQAYVHFYNANLDAARIKSNIDMVAARRIIEGCLSRQRGQILAAKDKKTGDMQAGVFCAWDSTSMYYLMTSRTLSSDNGAVSMLVWKAMQDAASRQLVFDFDGLATPGSIRFYTAFGGAVEPRYVATKMSMPVQAANALRGLLDKEQYFY